MGRLCAQTRGTGRAAPSVAETPGPGAGPELRGRSGTPGCWGAPQRKVGRAVPGGNSGFAGRVARSRELRGLPRNLTVRRAGCPRQAGAARVPSPAEHQDTQEHQQQESERAAGPPGDAPRGHRESAPRVETSSRSASTQPRWDGAGAEPLAGRLGNRAAAPALIGRGPGPARARRAPQGRGGAGRGGAPLGPPPNPGAPLGSAGRRRGFPGSPSRRAGLSEFPRLFSRTRLADRCGDTERASQTSDAVGAPGRVTPSPPERGLRAPAKPAPPFKTVPTAKRKKRSDA